MADRKVWDRKFDSKTTRINIRLNPDKPGEAELINFLNTKENKNRYIIELLHADYEKNGK